jgi:hypothetical protein
MTGSSESEWVLYTRPQCHLCDVAAALLNARGLSWRAQNIETDLDLIRRYGDKIPVLYRSEDGAELFWPFDDGDLRKLAITAK